MIVQVRNTHMKMGAHETQTRTLTYNSINIVRITIAPCEHAEGVRGACRGLLDLLSGSTRCHLHLLLRKAHLCPALQSLRALTGS